MICCVRRDLRSACKMFSVSFYTVLDPQDEAYEAAGAKISNGAALEQDIVLKVRPFDLDEVSRLCPGARWA